MPSGCGGPFRRIRVLGLRQRRACGQVPSPYAGEGLACGGSESQRSDSGFGLTARQARFLVLVLEHSGVCLPRQYRAFAGIAHGRQTDRFFSKLSPVVSPRRTWRRRRTPVSQASACPGPARRAREAPRWRADTSRDNWTPDNRPPRRARRGGGWRSGAGPGRAGPCILAAAPGFISRKRDRPPWFPRTRSSSGDRGGTGWSRRSRRPPRRTSGTPPAPRAWRPS